MRVYFDSSSFAKRFIDELGSDAVEEICTKATALGLSIFCVSEIVSALNRRQRKNSITQSQYKKAKGRLIEDVRDADLVNLTTSVISSSLAILERTPVRTLDALHIACALEWKAELFVSSDNRQIKAAKQAGLNIQEV